MLTVSKISKRFPGADEDILTDISFTVNGGERVALIGPNGGGKSTLLRIIAGETDADSGSVLFTVPGLRVGYLAQGMALPDDTPIYDALYPQASALASAEAQVSQLAEALAVGDDSPDTLAAYGDALERLLALSDTVDDGDGERMLAAMGLADVPPQTPVGALSGGQKTRLMLAALLLGNPQLLLLDEPTNHLDVRALEWLEDWLQRFNGGVLLVSHDRAFLDRVANRTVALDARAHTARVFDGGYSAYMDTVENELHKQWSAWRDQQVEIERLRRDVERMKHKALKTENTTVNDFWRGRSKLVAQKAKAKETRFLKYLESDERVDKPERQWTMKLEFSNVERVRRPALLLEDLSIGYTPEKPLLAHLTLAAMQGERVAIMGPNGHGKSTLLKSIAGQLTPLAGRVRLGAGMRVGYFAQEQDTLDANSTPLDTLLDAARMTLTEARTFLHQFLFAGDAVFTPVAQLSYGERARLMLARLVAQGATVLLLDEPLNHLDVPSREQFERALSSFAGTVLAVAHDRYFVERFATTAWHIADGALTRDLLVLDEA